jgi:hypothetical protein
MVVKIEEDNLKEGLLGLTVALVEILEEVLERQAIRRMEGGRLSEEEAERLGKALEDLRAATERIKAENGIEDAVKAVRDGLDSVADEAIAGMVDLEQWGEEAEGS